MLLDGTGVIISVLNETIKDTDVEEERQNAKSCF
jgi:hypothetical protein